MIISIKKLLKQLETSNEKFIIFGLSTTTKYVLDKYPWIISKISYIVDNNEKILQETYKNIPIHNVSILKSSDNIIIWGNHVVDIYKQLKALQITNLFIVNKYTNIYKLDLSNLFFYLETPNKTANLNDTNHQFTQKILQYLFLLYRPIHLKPICFKTEYHLKKRKVKKNTLLISYHSIGDKNINILRWKEGYLENMITFDKKGYSGWSSLCDKNIKQLLKSISHKKAKKHFKKISVEYIKNNKSKYIQPKINNFIFPKKDFIFFPLQTINDSVMIHSYYKPIELIKKIVKILNKHNIPLVIKQHPRCQSEKLKKLLLKYSKQEKIILYNGSIHEAIAKAKTIYTINSGVGFEALLHLKPVITFGKSDYMSMTKNLKNLDTIKENPFYKLNDYKKIEIKKFLYYYINKKCLFLNNDKKFKKIIDNFIKKYLFNE